MKEINNIDLIKPLLRFDLGIYHIQIIQRSKDNNPVTGLVTDFYIGSENYLNFIYPGIKELCKLYNARAYINLNPKKEESILFKVIESSLERLRNKEHKVLSLMSHSIDCLSGNGVKVWIVDIDEKISKEELDDMVFVLNNCRSGYDKNVLEIIPTKNGYHILTVPFDLKSNELINSLEIKKNASTLLYYGQVG